MYSLCFLHGFLGAKEDWLPVIHALQDEFICEAVDSTDHAPDFWVGYSMGGRRLLQAKRAPAILLSTHPGLATQQEKAARLQSDTVLAQCLRTEPLDQFLEGWYAQELFAPLREHKELFEELLIRRKNQDPFQLADKLLRHSLAHDSRPDSFADYLFVYGGKDLKFGELYRTLPPSAHVKKIEQAGHALHLENPSACATLIKEFVHEYTLRNV